MVNCKHRYKRVSALVAGALLAASELALVDTASTHGVLGGRLDAFVNIDSQLAPLINQYTSENGVVSTARHFLPRSSNEIVGASHASTEGHKSCGNHSSTTGVSCGSEAGASVWAVSFDQLSSSRTAIYAALGRINNGAAAPYHYVVGPATDSNKGSDPVLPPRTDVSTYTPGIKRIF